MIGLTQHSTQQLLLVFSDIFEKYWSNPSDVVQSTYQLGLANSIASIIVAFLSPFLGAVADRGSAKEISNYLCIFWSTYDKCSFYCDARRVEISNMYICSRYYWFYVRKYFL